MPYSDIGNHMNYNGPKVGIPLAGEGKLPPSWVTMRCAVGYMLETPSIRWYSFSVTPSSEDVAMSSENPSGADNQQETERDPQRLHAEHLIE